MEDHRCTAIDQGYRCQLLPHDDGQHVACVQFEIVRGGRDFASEYRAWGEPWTKGQPGIDPLRWAHTFPSAHELAA